jgi:hypothetical protein
MTREELVEVVARASREAPLLRDGRKPDPDYSFSPADLLRGPAAVAALCNALNIPPAALDALTAGEAVVVPKEATMRMNASAGPAVRAACGLDGKDGNMVGVWNCFLAASPYVVPEASA